MLKIDAALAAALSQAEETPEEPVLEVSVRARSPLTAKQVQELETFGIQNDNPRRTIFYARLPVGSLRALAQKPWIQRVSLAQKLRPVGAQSSES
jgi:hypothetical protein